MSKGVGVGDVVEVRLALLPGMPEEDPSDEELAELRLARVDAAAMDSLVKKRRAAAGKKDDSIMAKLTSQSLSEQFWLYPRRRKATVMYVERSGGGVKVMPSGAPGDLQPSTTGSVNLEVKTVGSTVMQPAIGHYPFWAQETFRLEAVPFLDEEPKDAQDHHVCYPVPEPKAE